MCKNYVLHLILNNSLLVSEWNYTKFSHHVNKTQQILWSEFHCVIYCSYQLACCSIFTFTMHNAFPMSKIIFYTTKNMQYFFSLQCMKGRYEQMPSTLNWCFERTPPIMTSWKVVRRGSRRRKWHVPPLFGKNLWNRPWNFFNWKNLWNWPLILWSAWRTPPLSPNPGSVTGCYLPIMPRFFFLSSAKAAQNTRK
jgi:hypothetical protein